ncbi:hypothetical protein FS837_000372 [Tulasnella sp. UAMH 9824]|nr:hypothetical protein FS837_000372 [Tulasnella sp. UAMH 9824]
MSENINEKNEVHQPTPDQAAGIDDVQDAMMRLRICPRNVLDSLSHLRIDGSRITPIESEAHKAGGKADVEPAVLTSAQPPGSGELQVPEYVAVKKLRFDSETDDDKALASFAHEVGLLNDLDHENVVKIIGFVEEVDNGVAWMVFSWEKNGNLREFVQAETWELPERVSLLNILVNSENRAVITDLGSARFVDSATEPVISGVGVANVATIQHQSPTQVAITEPLRAEMSESGEFITITGPAWTVRWAAPELLDGVLPGLESDIWAFGWICWEIVTGNFPFHEDNDVAVVQRILTKNLPVVSDHSQVNQIKMLCSLMEECLSLDADKRPLATRCQKVVSWMLQEGAIDRDQEYFRQSLEVSRSVENQQGEARAMHAIGGAYYLKGDYIKAREWYSQSEDLYHKIDDQLGVAQLVKALVAVYHIGSDYSKAEELNIQSGDLYSKIGYRPHVAPMMLGPGGKAYPISDERLESEEFFFPSDDPYFVTRDQLERADSSYTWGERWFMYHDYSNAEECYIISRDLYSSVEVHLGVARSADGLGRVYAARSEYPKAEESYIQCRDLYAKIGDQLGFAQSVKALGDVYRMQGEYSKAEEAYTQSRDLCSKIGDQLGFAQTVKTLGDVYRMQDDYSKAEESYLQSRDLCSTTIGDQLGWAHSAKSLGDLHRKRHEYSKAAEAYIQSRDLYSTIEHHLGFVCSVKALEGVQAILEERANAQGSPIKSSGISSNAGDRRSLARSLHAIAVGRLVAKQYTMAEEAYLEARQIYREIGDIRSFADISRYMSCMYRDRDQYVEAERLLQEASKIYSELGDAESVAQCEESLAKISRSAAK